MFEPRDFLIVGTTDAASPKVYYVVGDSSDERFGKLEEAWRGHSPDAYDIADQLNDEAREAGSGLVWRAEPVPSQASESNVELELPARGTVREMPS